MKTWQRGFPIEQLREMAQVFQRHDEGRVLGAFTGVKERTVADWLAAGELRAHGSPPTAAAVIGTQRARAQLRDFRGEVVATIPKGAARVRRMAGDEQALLEMLRAELPAGGEWWFDLWQEHPVDRAVAKALGLRRYAVKIRASSELIGVWADSTLEPQPLPREEVVGLCRLDLPPIDVEPLARALAERPPSFEQHYSSYNQRGSWTALALRGYGGDPGFIIKPSEMSKAWKAQNADKMAWECIDTPARAAYPEAQPLIEAAAAGSHGVERIRLMQLAPGGGELTRHADITDPDAGVAEGKYLRLHVPIVTNPGVRFRMWRLGGAVESCHMEAGSCWYLDTRKPHTAANMGESERLHLVMDVRSGPELLARLGARAEIER